VSDSAGGSYASDPDARLQARPGQRLAWDGLGRLSAVRPATGYAPPLATYAYDRLLDWTGTNSNLRYDPWGTLASSTGSSLPDFRFQGSWFDTATSLSWVISRWYAPSLGRFVSEDSLLGDPADPPSRHLYAYGAGEPVAHWDPDGRYSINYLEARYCSSPFNKAACYAAQDWAVWAKRERIRLFGPDVDSDRGNAFKHCIWAGGCTLELGPRRARTITDLHEYWVNGRYVDRPMVHASRSAWDRWWAEYPKHQMDRSNNSVGIHLAAPMFDYFQYAWDIRRARSTISAKCLNALRKGYLTWLRGAQMGGQ
jgi:RHS repeat-associated protein